jgi:hypothetical protein
MKEPWDWEEEDIELLITNEIQESLTLDYKRCESLDRKNPNWKTDLSKDVSAFANSAGGTIIYGVIEKTHLPIAIDAGYDPKIITRESIEQVINSTIQRRIDGIRIKQIVLKKNNPGNVIYVVNIPQSKQAPHMASNHIFYKRLNYQAMAMEEYEVRDVANRAEAPDLSIQFCLQSEVVLLEFEEGKDFSTPIKLQQIIINKSVVPAMYYIVRLCIDESIIVIGHADFSVNGQNRIQIGDVVYSLNYYSKNFSIPGVMPVFQGVNFILSESGFQISVPRVNQNKFYALEWSIDSVGMQSKSGNAFLIVLENERKVQIISA